MNGKRPEKSFLPPLKVKSGDFENNTNYDMLSQHIRYNRLQLRRFMRSDAKYITIIREPSEQWESAFEHFRFHDVLGRSVASNKWLDTFLERPSYFREKLKFIKYEDVLGLRWYYAQNSQMYDLGLDGESFYNETVINGTIKSIENEFTLVLIMEYFDESLLVLKKELCWEYEDIVYVPKNQREKRPTLSFKIRQKIVEFNHADFLLYHHFNQTLWKKIDEYGSTFDADLRYFRELKSRLFKECGKEKPDVKKLGSGRIYKHVEFSPRKNASLFCRTLTESKRTLYKRLYDRQNVKIKQ